MALQIWLPLCKEEDFLNKGLADITVKGSPEYDLNGKIGGCYKNYYGKYLTISHNISDTTEFSFAYWINIPSTITLAKALQLFMIFSGKSNDVLSKAVVIWTDYNLLKWYNSTGWDLKLWQSFSYDTWYHISVVHTSGNFKIYINGELESRNYNTSSILKLTAGNIMIGSGLNSTYSKVKFNDFRVYDHCLSPKEVKEISKGLVLHYPLNNIISNTVYDCSGYCNNVTITGSLTTSNNTPRYDKCTVFNTNLTITINDTNTYITDLITVSFWAKCNLEFNSYQFNIGDFKGGIFIRKDASSYYHLLFEWTGYTDSGEIKGGGRYVVKPIQLNHWYFVTYIFNKGKITIYLDGVSTGTEDRSTKYTKIKITSSKKIGNFDGYISDFRIYSTALSDEDIKELYNTSVLIDNQLNLSAYSFNETSKNNINKSGILNSNLFIEDSNAEIYEDKTKANQIIEI